MKERKETEDIQENKLWKKIGNYAKTAGEKLVYSVLTLHYTSQKKEVPTWVKTTIYSSLIYFISPIDSYPDFLPGGFVDDYAVVASALATIAVHIDEEVKNKAKNQTDKIFRNS